MPDIVFSLLAEDEISAVFDKLTGTVESLIGGSIKLAGSFEQTQIAFGAMLGGNKAAADDMLAKLQTLANLTPFTFEGEQGAARELLAMGQAADKVLPELKDIDTAVSAIGGGDQQVNRVTQAIAKMDAEGKVSAVFMNELTRDGIPAWTMLAESMGLSVEQVRALSTQGALAASQFDTAFHTYTVEHWGALVQQQSQTFDGLISTASDFGQQLERAFGSPIIQALEPKMKALLNAMQDPGVVAAIHAWGVEIGKFLTQIIDVGVELARWAGIPIPDLTKPIADASGALDQFNGNWASTGPKVETVKDQVKGMRDAIAGQRDDVAAVDAGFANQTATLRNQQATFDAGIAAQLAGISAAKAASDAASQSRLDSLHAQVSALQEAYALEDQRIALTRDQTQLGVDQAEAVNRFSASGAAARIRVTADEQRIADEQRKIARTGTLDALQDRIAAEEAHKRAADATFAARTAGLENERRQVDANLQAELRGIEDRKRAYDEASATRIRGEEAAIRQVEAAQIASIGTVTGIARTAADGQADYLRGMTQSQLDAWRLAQAAIERQASSVHDGEFLAGQIAPPMSGLFQRIFGTPDQQIAAGTNLAGNVAKAIGGWAWDTLGKELGGGLLGGVLKGLSSPAARSAEGDIFSAVGDKFMAELTGNKAGIANADARLAAAYTKAVRLASFGADYENAAAVIGDFQKVRQIAGSTAAGAPIGPIIDTPAGRILAGQNPQPPGPPQPGQPGYIGPVRPAGATPDHDSRPPPQSTTVNVHVNGFVGNPQELAHHISKVLADNLYGGG